MNRRMKQVPLRGCLTYAHALIDNSARNGKKIYCDDTQRRIQERFRFAGRAR